MCWGDSGQRGVWRPQDWLAAMCHKTDFVEILCFDNGISTVPEASRQARYQQGRGPLHHEGNDHRG